jgi:hypothetical protein
VSVTAEPTAGQPVALPELAVEPHVLVLPVPNDGDVDRFVAEWLAVAPELGAQRTELEQITAAACTESQQGEVAVFLSYRVRGDDLVGGAALLTLELLDPMAGDTEERAGQLSGALLGCAERLGHTDGLAEVEVRRTVSGVAAVRLRFLAVVATWPDRLDTPVVEACRWLYPVPDHPDLAWSLLFQTTDLGVADDLVEEFDRLARSLSWAVDEEDGPATDAGADEG